MLKWPPGLVILLYSNEHADSRRNCQTGSGFQTPCLSQRCLALEEGQVLGVAH